ncbi:hypothetical protein D9615_003462 [Tricholomella constricta]|uniref:Uncharacterized protein n=1 Tax=Tricholomella constricta TaxID=117010 RepID=A0A8H5HJ42_9AGAR|nr:hypothetical protein D9615_003462 [Tricholomella constricta]
MAGKTPTSSASARVQAGRVKAGTGKAPASARTHATTGTLNANKATGGAIKAPTYTATPKAPGGKVSKK